MAGPLSVHRVSGLRRAVQTFICTVTRLI